MCTCTGICIIALFIVVNTLNKILLVFSSRLVNKLKTTMQFTIEHYHYALDHEIKSINFNDIALEKIIGTNEFIKYGCI